MGTVKTKHSAIFDFWKDKAISKDGNVLIDYGYEGCDETILKKTEAVGAIYDWGEPQCMACGKPIDCFGNPKYSIDLKSNVSAIWNYPEIKSNLQRAHIIPALLGGEDRPDNLLLLCHRCHRDSPDVSDKRMILKWVFYRRQQPSYELLRFSKALQILEKDYDMPLPLFSDKVFDKNNFLKRVGTHGGSIPDSTLIAYYISDALEEKDRQQAEQMRQNDIIEKYNAEVRFCNGTED